MKKQKTKKVKEKKSLLKLAVQGLLIITVILFLAAGFRIRTFSRGYPIRYDARDYVYSVEYNRFDDLYETTISHMERDVIYDEQVTEFRALAFYYEQAVLEKAYEEAGESEKAAAFREKKEEYRKELGSVSSKANAVDELLAKYD